MNRSCKWVKEKIDSYLDNSLNDVQIKDFEEHVSKCEECRQELNELRYVLSLAKEIKEVKPPNDFTYNVMEKIDKEDKINKKSKLYFFRYATPLVAAMLVVAFIYIFSDGLLMKKNNDSISENANNADFEIADTQVGANSEGKEKTSKAEINYNDNCNSAFENESVEITKEDEDENANDIKTSSNNTAYIMEDTQNYEFENYEKIKIKIQTDKEFKLAISEIELLISEYTKEYDKFYYSDNNLLVDDNTELKDIKSASYLFNTDVISADDLVDILLNDYEILIIPYEGNKENENIEITIDIIQE